MKPLPPRDVNNIGIDAIGGETDIQPNPALVARNGVFRGNRVMRARSSYGGGFAGGIYIDGGRDIVVENNVVTESDLGIEIGAENPGIVARNIIVRDNVLYANDKACLVFGGYAASRGRVADSRFTGNTCWHNDTLGAGFGELWIQWADDNAVRGNVFVATAQNLLLLSDAGNAGTLLDWNLWYTPGGAAAARFVWNGAEHVGFAVFVLIGALARAELTPMGDGIVSAAPVDVIPDDPVVPEALVTAVPAAPVPEEEIATWPTFED